MTGRKPSDAELIEASLSQPRAFEAIFERHYPHVHRYLERRVGPGVGDDLASETFAQAYASRERYDLSRSNAFPWLLGIGTNLLRHHLRAEAAQLAAYSKQAGRERDVLEQRLEERADLARAVPHVAEALRAIRIEERNVLLLIGWADLSYQETADALGIPIGTVRSRLGRARSQVRAILESVPEVRELNVVWEDGGEDRR